MKQQYKFVNCEDLKIREEPKIGPYVKWLRGLSQKKKIDRKKKGDIGQFAYF